MTDPALTSLVWGLCLSRETGQGSDTMITVMSNLSTTSLSTTNMDEKLALP